jgi:hypothetical protein
LTIGSGKRRALGRRKKILALIARRWKASEVVEEGEAGGRKNRKVVLALSSSRSCRPPSWITPNVALDLVYFHHAPQRVLKVPAKVRADALPISR